MKWAKSQKENAGDSRGEKQTRWRHIEVKEFNKTDKFANHIVPIQSRKLMNEIDTE